MAFSGFKFFPQIKSYTDTQSILNNIGVGDIGGVGSFINTTSLQVPSLGLNITRVRRFELGEYGYIVDTVTRERLPFQYNVNANETGGANYTEFPVLARSVPQYHYKGGKVRTLQLPITFTMRQDTREDVMQNMRWLQSLAYPEYGSGDQINIAPHPVVLIQGQLYVKDIWIVRDYSITWGEARDPVTQLPSEATCNLTMTEVSSGFASKGHAEVIRL